MTVVGQRPVTAFAFSLEIGLPAAASVINEKNVPIGHESDFSLSQPTGMEPDYGLRRFRRLVACAPGSCADQVASARPEMKEDQCRSLALSPEDAPAS